MFVGPQGARVDAGNLSARMLKPTCEAAGVGGWPTWHTFRHTCASQLFRNGWNAKQVSRFLGHTDAGFTLRTYVHVLDEDLPEPGVLASLDGHRRGNKGATEQPETDRSAGELEGAPIHVLMRDSAYTPNLADVAGSDYESAALTS